MQIFRLDVIRTDGGQSLGERFSHIFDVAVLDRVRPDLEELKHPGFLVVGDGDMAIVRGIEVCAIGPVGRPVLARSHCSQSHRRHARREEGTFL